MDVLTQLDTLLRSPSDSPSDHKIRVEALFFSISSIAEQLPVDLSDRTTSFKLTELRMNCGRCDRDLPDHLVRGRVSKLISSVASISSYSYCIECNLITSNTLRAKADESIEFLTPKGWRRVRPKQKPISLVRYISERLRAWYN